MRETHVTTPFGRRSVPFGQIAAQIRVQRAVEDAASPGSNHPAAVNKWTLFATLASIRERLGVSDRALSVLNALLSFHPETALTLPAPPDDADDAAASCDLVVFPSNKALCLRAHGMAEPTLRRHIAALVEAGLIIRRDSPNGKRYARKDHGGQERFLYVFGFDLTPLVVRAPEFETMAETQRLERQRLTVLRERITLHRRDVAAMIACGLDEGLPGDWESLRMRLLALAAPLRKAGASSALAEIESNLGELRRDVVRLIETRDISIKMNGNDADFERHHSKSNTQPISNFEPASRKQEREADLPLSMVLEACPDIVDYGVGAQISSWSGFLAAARVVRPMIGISPDAWKDACETLGETTAAIVLASILQRSEHSSEARSPVGAAGIVVNGSPAIRSPGGYLRALTEKAKKGAFSPGPVVMALIGQRLKARRASVDRRPAAEGAA